MNDPPLLLADEPTGNLDSATTVEVLTLLRRFHTAGQTIVVVTHDERVATAAQRVVSLRDGRVVDETRLDGGTGRPLTVGDLVEG
jgi:putative ABC transport system ATP-binding protein